jgi:4-amino-4-deoxy-L-arabinose transferase-like glycosyltransferase
VVPFALVCLLSFVRDWRNRDFRRGVLIAFAVMLPLMLAYPLAMIWWGFFNSFSDPRWFSDVVLNTPLLDTNRWHVIAPTYWLQILPWYALPSLPFALWLWWKDRQKLRERIELALPLVAFVAILVSLSFTREARDNVGLILLLPLALAAASVLDRMPREVARIMDWFGLVFFGLVAVLLWTTWTSALTGLPRNFARWVGLQAPGFELQFSWFTFTLAIALTLVWMYAVIRAHRNNRRAVVNWAAGMTLVWVLVNLLGLNAVDHVRSYRGVASAVASRVNARSTTNADERCVIAIALGDAQRVSLQYFGKLNITRQEESIGYTCRWVIEQVTSNQAGATPNEVVTVTSTKPDGSLIKLPWTSTIDGKWSKVWQGARPGEKVELLRLYRRD